MFILYFFQVLISFSLAYYTFYQYAGPIGGSKPGDWIAFIIMDGGNLALTIFFLFIVFVLLSGPSKFALELISNPLNNFLNREKWKGLFLLILILNVFLYLLLQFEIYLFIPLSLYLLARVILQKSL